jgi:hypothetical protein
MICKLFEQIGHFLGALVVSSGWKLGIAVVLMFAGWGLAQHDRADATVLIPEGTAVGTQTDQFQLNSQYTAPTGSQPFAAAPFSLAFTVPSEVQFSNLGSGDFGVMVSGSYTNNGMTTAFTKQQVFFFPYDGFSFVAQNFLGGTFSLGATFTQPLYQISYTNVGGPGGVVADASFNTGTFFLNSKYYNGASFYGDPQFTGGSGSLEPTSLPEPTSVPEPSSVVLLLAPLGLLAFLRHRRAAAKPAV